MRIRAFALTLLAHSLVVGAAKSQGATDQCPASSMCKDGCVGDTQSKRLTHLDQNLGGLEGMQWFSEVFHRPATPNFCYYRAVLVQSPPNTSIFWKPGGIRVRHVAEPGCYVLCTPELRSYGSKPIEGPFEIGFGPRAKEKTFAWGPEGRWSDYDSVEKRPVIKPQEIPVGVRIPSRTTFRDKDGAELGVEFSVHRREDRRVSYAVRNLGKKVIQIEWHLPKNNSFRRQAEQLGSRVLLPEGQGIVVSIDLTQLPEDKDVQLGLYASAATIFLYNEYWMTVAVPVIAPTNGELDESPAATWNRQK